MRAHTQMRRTTAAVGEGLSMQAGGILTVMGARQPWLSGMSAVTRQRSA